MDRLKAIRRYELKYLLDRDQALAVMADLEGFVSPDSYAAGRSSYSVTSLYFDTVDHKSYWDKIDGHKFRRKVRVRVYGDDPVTPATPVFVEIKQRLDRALEKRRVSLPYQHAATLRNLDDLAECIPPAERPVLRDVTFLVDALQLEPACVVSYRRVALNGSGLDPGLRITFDTQLKGRVHDLSLAPGGHAGSTYFIAPDRCVMEVKINHRLPFWLMEILARHNCVLRRISKYCAALEAAGGVRQRRRIAS